MVPTNTDRIENLINKANEEGDLYKALAHPLLVNYLYEEGFYKGLSIEAKKTLEKGIREALPFLDKIFLQPFNLWSLRKWNDRRKCRRTL